ncbi:MAG: DUF3109 family protein [Bacteroidales bacterium]|nr:DUF3109 family protein [Bacteroidales bacterium]
MLQIKDTLISLDLIDRQFCCDLIHCGGICCVEGESGAPVEMDEIAELENALPHIWEDLSEEAKVVIKKQGVVYTDHDGEMVTSIVNGKDCVFTCYDGKGLCLCAIEKAWRVGKISFMKPISCHLYPVRIKRFNDFTAVNYQEWSICSSARLYGEQLRLPVYQFLKEPLIRKFGQEWYDELCEAAEMLKSGMNGDSK